MNRTRLASAGLALGAALALPACQPAAGAPVDCGFVGFAPNTDWGAFEIKATNTGCATARTVARGAKTSYERAYRAGAFFCPTPTIHEEGLRHAAYRCTAAGGKVVTFIAS